MKLLNRNFNARPYSYAGNYPEKSRQPILMIQVECFLHGRFTYFWSERCTKGKWYITEGNGVGTTLRMTKHIPRTGTCQVTWKKCFNCLYKGDTSEAKSQWNEIVKDIGINISNPWG